MNDTGSCIGSLDVRANHGVDADVLASHEGHSMYVMNVVVAEDHRGRGIGRQLVEAAQAVAAQELGVAQLFAHVETGNEVAAGLYARCGFEEVRTEGGVGGGSTVGQQVLLRWRAPP